MKDIAQMTARELIVGLMRGDKATFKQGYSAEAATLVAIEYNNIQKHSPLHDRLLAFAEGYAVAASDRDVTTGLTNTPSASADVLERS